MNLLLLGTVLVLSAVTLIAGWLLYTESGANWAWARATAAMPERLSATRVEGSLRRGFRLTEFRYQDAATDLRISDLRLALNPDLVPTAINVEGLAINGLTLQLTPGDDEPAAEPTDISAVLAGLELPFLLRVRDLDVRNAALLTEDGNAPLSIDSLQLDGSMRRRLDLERLRLVTGDTTLDVQAALELPAPHAVSLTATAGGSLPASISESAGPQTARLEVSGNLARLQLKLASESQPLEVAGTVYGITDELRFDLTARSDELRWPLAAANPQVVLQALELAVTGAPQNYEFELETLISAGGIDRVQASGRGSGDLASLRLAALNLASEPLQAGLSGEVAWAQAMSLVAELNLQRLDPAHWQAGWPDGQPLHGRLAASFAGSRLELARFELQQRDTGAGVSGNGVVDIDGGIVDLSLRTQSLQWPVAPASPDLSSPAATLVVSGSPDDWRVDGDIALQTPDLPEGRVAISGGGNLDGLKLAITDGQLLGGGIEGNVAYNWSDGGSWSADLNIRNTQTTPLLPAWPGRLSASFDTTGRVSPLVANVNIRRLDGELRARPIAASGRLHLADGSLSVEKLQLSSADSSLALDGATHAAGGLAFTLNVASLTDLLPGAAGELQATGTVRDGDGLPRLQLQLEGRELALAGWSLATVEMSNTPLANQPLGLQFVASDVARDDLLMDSLTVSLQGREAEHRFAGALAAGDRQLAVIVQGNLQRGKEISASQWQGQLATLSAAVGEEVAVTLRDPADIEASPAAVKIARLCLDVSSGGAVCSEGSWQQDGRTSATLDLQAFPLDLLRYAGVSDLVLTQAIDGSMAISSGSSGDLTAKGRIDISPGEIRNSYDERLTLRTRAGFASVDLKDGRLLSGEVSLPFSDAAEIRGAFNVVNVGAGTASPIDGSLKVNVRDIGVGARIVPQIDAAGGSLDADLRVAGTLAAPEFAGGMTIRNGFFAYDPLGLRLDELQLDGQIRPGNRLEVESRFRVGEGRATLSSSADYLQGRSAGLELSLSGENLRLVNLDDLSVTVNPDLQFVLRDNDVSINGRLGVPSARLASVNVIAGGVSESDDVVYVGEEQPTGEEQLAVSPLNFSGAVALELGDDIVIDLNVAEARLGGQSEFRWQGPAVPVANGAFELTGKFEAYGQLLTITEGSIRYPNVAADSPLLRIRAEREIFGNSQVRSAGVLVSGSALQPQVEVYTNPATTRDRALTLLVTGSDFNYEQGVGAVDVGTYIAPKLYASYGIGLFDKENVISVRYDLAKGFGIKATSGKRAAGIDISYTISN